MVVQKLSEIGRITRYSLPYEAEIIVEYANKVLTNAISDVRDILLHDYQLTAMNCRIRYDTFMKVKIDSFKCTKLGISLSVEERTTTGPISRRFVSDTWPRANFFSLSDHYPFEYPLQNLSLSSEVCKSHRGVNFLVH